MTALESTTHRVNRDKAEFDWLTICSLLLTVMVTVAALYVVATAKVPATIEEAAHIVAGR